MRKFDWYYSDGDLPLTNKERREIRRNARILWMRRWRNKALYFTLVFLLIGVASAIGWYGPSNVGQMAILFTIYTGLWVLVFSIVQRFSILPVARRLLRQRGIDVCIRCGYWLRDLGKDITECPECGWRRENASSQGDIKQT